MFLSTVLKNSGVFLFSFFVKFSDILVFIYLLRTFGIVNYGQLKFAETLTFYVNLLITYGFYHVGTKNITLANINHNNKQIGQIISSILLMQILLSYFVFVVSYILVNSIETIKSIKYEFFFYICISIIRGLYPLYVYHGVSKRNINSVLNNTFKILLCISILLLIRNTNDILMYLNLCLLSDFLKLCVSYFLILRNIRLQLPDLSIIRLILNDGFYPFLIQLHTVFYAKFSNIFLGFTLGNIAVAINSICDQIILLIKKLNDLIFNVIYPFVQNKLIINNKKQINNFFYTIFYYSIPVIITFCGLFYYFADNIYALITGLKDINNINFIRTNILILPLLLFNNFLSMNIFIYNKGMHITSVLMCIVICIISHILLVPHFGIIGTAYSNLISEIFFSVLIAIVYSKVYL